LYIFGQFGHGKPTPNPEKCARIKTTPDNLTFLLNLNRASQGFKQLFSNSDVVFFGQVVSQVGPPLGHVRTGTDHALESGALSAFVLKMAVARRVMAVHSRTLRTRIHS
jgi:hypothetical protein